MQKSVLIVDDSQTIRDCLHAFLFPKGYNLMMAENGKEALKTIEKERPDLIITDIEMPEMTGFELLNHLKNNMPYFRVPVIVITSRANSEDVRQAIALGAIDYIVKPFHRQALYEKLDRIFEKTAATPLKPVEPPKKPLTTANIFVIKNPLSAIYSIEYLCRQYHFDLPTDLRLKSKIGIEYKGIMPLELVDQLRDLGLDALVKTIHTESIVDLSLPIIMYINPFNFPIVRRIEDSSLHLFEQSVGNVQVPISEIGSNWSGRFVAIPFFQRIKNS